MINLARFLTMLIGATVLVACGDSKEITEDKLRPIAQQYLQKKSANMAGACRKLYWPEGKFGCVLTPVEHRLIQRGWMANQRLPTGPGFPPPLPSCQLDVTPEGRKGLIGLIEGYGPEAKTGLDVCYYSSYELVGIDKWTPANTNAFGETISVMTFRYKVAGVPDWVRKVQGDADVREFLKVPNGLESDHSVEVIIHLTNKGWEQWDVR